MGHHSIKDIEVLVSTMNESSCHAVLRNLRLGSDDHVTIINQITNAEVPLRDFSENKIHFFSYAERGLSRSRNRALLKSTGDICVIADDDMFYAKDYQKIIAAAFRKYPNADIIAFHVDSENERQRRKKMAEGRIGFFRSFRIASWQIAFRRSSVLNKNIHFDEQFGTGSTYFCGEENIFLADCLRAGLKIYYVPQKIATLKISESTWDHGHTADRYRVQGAVFYRMSSFWCFFSICQFVVRKRRLYKNNLSMRQAFINMSQGAREYAFSKRKKDIDEKTNKTIK